MRDSKHIRENDIIKEFWYVILYIIGRTKLHWYLPTHTKNISICCVMYKITKYISVALKRSKSSKNTDKYSMYKTKYSMYKTLCCGIFIISKALTHGKKASKWIQTTPVLSVGYNHTRAEWCMLIIKWHFKHCIIPKQEMHKLDLFAFCYKK